MTQVVELISNSSQLQSGDLRTIRAEGRQAIGECYEYRVLLETSLEGGLAVEVIEDMLAAPCRLEISAIGEQPNKLIHGVLSEIELQSMHDAARALYEVTLVPALHRLGLTVRSRTFENMLVQEILADVLDGHGIVHTITVATSHDEPLEYVVQYQESDLAFISRLMERWGLFYVFEQGSDEATVVIVDRNEDLTLLPEHERVPYVVQGAASEGDQDNHVLALSRRHRVVPETLELLDYNYRVATGVTGTADVDTTTGQGTQILYGEHFVDNSIGDALALVRAQERAALRETYRGEASLRTLAAGHRFFLTGYPASELEIEYVVTSIEERCGFDDAAYRCRFEAIPSTVPFRKGNKTPRPRIHGFMHAVISGAEDGMVAPIDEDGRYTVEMYLTPPAGNAIGSTPVERKIRMAQPLSGAQFGVHFPLIAGTEVILVHLDGDPDRPVIAGAIPNHATTSPVTLDDATKSRIKTKSGILMEFEDAG